MTRRPGFPLLLLALAILPVRGAAAQEGSDFIHLQAARLAASVGEASAAAPAALHVITLEQRDHHALLTVRRTESSPPELHEQFDDLYVVREGAAVLVYGGSYEGGETAQPGEWRGGTIVAGSRQPLAPGDIVVVPAEVAHQLEIEPGGSIIYHIVKVRRAK